MSDADQIRQDMVTIIEMLGELPTRAELLATEKRIRAEVKSFGQTIGVHMGHVLQRLETLEHHRVEQDKSELKNGKHRRPAVVR